MKGEFEFIEDIKNSFPAPPEGILGIGDDCAVLPQKNGMDTLVSTDMLVEGTHFVLNDIGPYNLGWKAAASNFSDIAAMGGRPVGMLLACAYPSDLSQDWRDEFIRGVRDISLEYGFPLLGGDTTCSKDKVSICITVLGQAPHSGAKLRGGALPGDRICVSGTLGDSSAGLWSILHGNGAGRIERELVKAHYHPLPRIELGMELGAMKEVGAMMDISDGLGSDLRHILKASGVGAVVDTSKLPLSASLREFCSQRGLDARDFALEGGEDYELLFTLRPGTAVPKGCTQIGEIRAEEGLEWVGGEKDYMGYRHF